MEMGETDCGLFGAVGVYVGTLGTGATVAGLSITVEGDVGGIVGTLVE